MTETDWAAIGQWKTGRWTEPRFTSRRLALDDVDRLRKNPAIRQVQLLQRTTATRVYLTYHPEK